MNAFTAKYGDYYVGALSLGADSGVLVTQDIDEESSIEKLKIEIEAQVLCFSYKETIADQTFAAAHSDLRFGITAFDTMTFDFVDLPNALTLEETRKLGALYDQRTEELAARVESRLHEWDQILSGDTKLGWQDVKGIIETGMVIELVLLPFAKLREVRPYTIAGLATNEA